MPHLMKTVLLSMLARKDLKMSLANHSGNNTCGRADIARNAKQLKLPNFGFAGIPENLIINIIIAAILVGVFVTLKKAAWALGKLQLVHRRLKAGEIGSFTSIFYGPPLHRRGSDPASDAADLEEIRLLEEGNTAFGWLSVAIKLQDRHLHHRIGQDAVDYLQFQRLIIFILAIASLGAMLVLLPINYIYGAVYGHLQSDRYARTTIGNIDAKQWWVIIHIGFAVLLFPVVVYIIHKKLKLQLKSTLQRKIQMAPYRTLVACNVPRHALNEDRMRQHFTEAYSPEEVELHRVTFSFDTTKLGELTEEKRSAEFCRHWCRARKRKLAQHDLPIHPVHCQTCCCCGCCRRGEEVDGEEFYRHESDALDERMDRAADKARKTTTSYVFLTFANHEQAQRVKNDFDGHSRHCTCFGVSLTGPRSSSVSDMLRVRYWNLKFAPLPRFINWYNLSSGAAVWWIRAILLNLAIFVLMFFFTTPPLVVNYLSDKVPFLMEAPILSQWLPTLLLLILPIVMPTLILYSVRWTGYYSCIREQYVALRNLFLFLLFTLCILPGLGLSSAEAAFQWFLQQATPGETQQDVQWDCVFLPSGGSFFINFIIALSLLGNALDLLRVGQLIVFELQRCWARSEAERAEVNTRRTEFVFPTGYATLLTVYSIAIVFGFMCPIILPVGLVYVVLKNIVDKYNLFFATTPGDIQLHHSTGLHLGAMRFVFVALFMQQFTMTFFAFLRGVPKPISIFILISTIVVGIFLIYEFNCAQYIDLDMMAACTERLQKEEAKAGGTLDYESPAFRRYYDFVRRREERQRHEASIAAAEAAGGALSSMSSVPVAMHQPRTSSVNGSIEEISIRDDAGLFDNDGYYSSTSSDERGTSPHRVDFHQEHVAISYLS